MITIKLINIIESEKIHKYITNYRYLEYIKQISKYSLLIYRDINNFEPIVEYNNKIPTIFYRRIPFNNIMKAYFDLMKLQYINKYLYKIINLFRLILKEIDDEDEITKIMIQEQIDYFTYNITYNNLYIHNIEKTYDIKYYFSKIFTLTRLDNIYQYFNKYSVNMRMDEIINFRIYKGDISINPIKSFFNIINVFLTNKYNKEEAIKTLQISQKKKIIYISNICNYKENIEKCENLLCKYLNYLDIANNSVDLLYYIINLYTDLIYSLINEITLLLEADLEIIKIMYTKSFKIQLEEL